MTNTIHNEHLSEEILPGNIIKRTFLKSSRQALDLYFESINHHNANLPADTRYILSLTDATHDVPPIQYGITKFRTGAVETPEQITIYLAVLMKNDPMTGLVRTLINRLYPNGKTRFFREHEEADAIEWLLAMGEKHNRNT